MFLEQQTIFGSLENALNYLMFLKNNFKKLATISNYYSEGNISFRK